MAAPSDASLLRVITCGYDAGTWFVALGYCITSSLLSIINKFAVLHFPFPAALTGFQYAVSAAAVIVLSTAGWVEPVNLVDVQSVRQMFPVLLTFYGSVYSNMKVLQHANVETFIVFRSITPLIVAIADPIFRPHVASHPSPKTIGSLVLIFVGALGYTLMDSTFSVTSYGWGALYVTIFCTEMIYVKDVVSHIKLSNWGLVYYNNGIGTLMSILVVLLTNETGSSPRGASTQEGSAAEAASQARRALLASGSGVDSLGLDDGGDAYSPRSLAVTGIVVSCIFGLGISFFGFSVRRKISATAFTVMGCTNKLLTLLVNTLVWDKHASLGGQASLLVCIAGGVLYGELSKADTEHNKKKKAAMGGGDAAAPLGLDAGKGGGVAPGVDVEMEATGGKQPV